MSRKSRRVCFCETGESGRGEFLPFSFWEQQEAENYFKDSQAFYIMACFLSLL